MNANNPRRSGSAGKRQPRLPRMLKHSSGQARVKLGGRIHYLGSWGSAEAHARYAELLKEYIEAGKRPLERAPTVPQATLTVADLFKLYSGWIDATGKYLKAGSPTSPRQLIADVTSSFVAFVGSVPVARLTEALLVQWRDRIESNPRLTRNGINRKVGALLAILKWGRSRGYVPKTTWAEVSAIEPLKRGQCGSRPEQGRPRRAPSFDEIERVALAAPRQIAAMLRLQTLTGMRPGEVCKVRWQDIDQAGPVVDGIATWIYTVADGKTSHHGHATRYALPPAAQVILRDFPALPSASIFSPAGTMADRRRELRAARATPITKQTRDRDANAQRDYCDCWDAHTGARRARRRGRAATVMLSRMPAPAPASSGSRRTKSGTASRLGRLRPSA